MCIGGGIRIPKVQENLKAYLKNLNLSANLNGDEAFAWGASVIAANVSHYFKVKPIYTYCGYPYRIMANVMSLDHSNLSDLYDKSINIIEPLKISSRVKSIKFPYTRDFQISLYEVRKNNETFLYAQYNIYNVSEFFVIH